MIDRQRDGWMEGGMDIKIIFIYIISVLTLCLHFSREMSINFDPWKKKVCSELHGCDFQC